MNYGYARVSTKEQYEDRQLLTLKNADIDRIFVDKQSGRDFNRPEWKKLKKN